MKIINENTFLFMIPQVYNLDKRNFLNDIRISLMSHVNARRHHRVIARRVWAKHQRDMQIERHTRTFY